MFFLGSLVVKKEIGKEDYDRFVGLRLAEYNFFFAQKFTCHEVR
jgi:hypothetical protein